MALSNQCSIYLKFGSKKIKIPVNPKEIEMEYPTDHETYDVLGIGEIVVPKRPSLQSASWECFFPKNASDPYVNPGAKDPEYYVNFLEKARKNKQIGRLIVSRSGSYDTNMKCIISEFTFTDKGGEPGDVYYSLKLQEYRDYSPEVVSIVTTPAAPGPEATIVAAEAETTRAVEEPVLRVGAAVVVNGDYCYDSYGGKPHKTANNISTTVTRIVSGNPYPIHVGSYGWVQESQIQITG